MKVPHIGYFGRHKLTVKESIQADRRKSTEEETYYIEIKLAGGHYALIKEHTFKTKGDAHIFIAENEFGHLCVSAEVITEAQKKRHYD